MAEWTTDQLVEELFARCFTAVFSWRKPDGSVQLRPQGGGGSSVGLGLACRLESECARATLSPSQRPDVARLLGDYPPLQFEPLDFATTDQVLAELMRVTPGDWVLGLFRLRKNMLHHWSGLCWHGSAPTCTGLAAVMANVIEGNIRTRRLAEGGSFREQLAKPLNAVHRNLVAEDTGGRTWAIGYLRVCEGLCEEYTARGAPEGNLARFVDMDEP